MAILAKNNLPIITFDSNFSSIDIFVIQMVEDSKNALGKDDSSSLRQTRCRKIRNTQRKYPPRPERNKRQASHSDAGRAPEMATQRIPQTSLHHSLK